MKKPEHFIHNMNNLKLFEIMNFDFEFENSMSGLSYTFFPGHKETEFLRQTKMFEAYFFAT